MNRRKPTRRGINAEASNVSHHHFTQGGSCAYCGSKHPPRKCPAYGVNLLEMQRQKSGGFRKKVYQLETDHPDDNGYLFVGTVKESKATRQKRNGTQ